MSPCVVLCRSSRGKRYSKCYQGQQRPPTLLCAATQQNVAVRRQCRRVVIVLPHASRLTPHPAEIIPRWTAAILVKSYMHMIEQIKRQGHSMRSDISERDATPRLSLETWISFRNNINRPLCDCAGRWWVHATPCFFKHTVWEDKRFCRRAACLSA